MVSSLFFVFFTGCQNSYDIPEHFEELVKPPVIFPDYSGVTIPPNIAPLNFTIEETGTGFITVISGSVSLPPMILRGKTVDIPLSSWRTLLRDNSEKEIYFEIYAKQEGQWKQFQRITNTVAGEPIAPWISYRLIPPGYEHFPFVGLYQRHLESFQEDAFFKGNLVNEKTCTNCHSFQNYSTDSFSFHTRVVQGGTIIVHKGEATKVNTRTEETGSNCAYPSWHPWLPLVAFSVNDTSQVFHARSVNKVEVFDSYSDLVLYDVENHTITPIFPQSDELFETLPYWAPDGKTLYFCLAKLDSKVSRNRLSERHAEIRDRFTELKYNLMKVSFDPHTRTFGHSELVFDASSKGQSAVFPRVNPDGKTLLFTLSSYGTFPIWHPESDLWLLDLETGQARALSEVNSDESESYHSWDPTGAWFVFSSRRDDGSYTRLYFSHKNEDGSFSKPFLLPQKDPQNNIDLMKSYNVPEMMKEPVDISITKLAHVAREKTPRDVLYIPKRKSAK